MAIKPFKNTPASSLRFYFVYIDLMGKKEFLPGVFFPGDPGQ